MTKRRKARTYGRSLPLSTNEHLYVTLFANNGREVWRGPVIEAHHHTWLGLFMGYTQDRQRVHVNVTKEYTQWCVGSPVTGKWRTWWHDPDEDAQWG